MILVRMPLLLVLLTASVLPAQDSRPLAAAERRFAAINRGQTPAAFEAAVQTIAARLAAGAEAERSARLQAEAAAVWILQSLWELDAKDVETRLAALDAGHADARLVGLLAASRILAALQSGDRAKAAELAAAVGVVTETAIAAPFQNERGSGFAAANPCESDFGEGQTFDGKDRKIAWRYPEAAVPSGLFDTAAMIEPDTQSVAYFAFAVLVPEPTQALVFVGVGGAVKLLVNRSEILSVEGERDDYSFDKEFAVAPFARGWNLVVVKTAAEEKAVSLRIRVTDTTGRWPSTWRRSALAADLASAAKTASSGPGRALGGVEEEALDDVRSGIASDVDAAAWAALRNYHRNDKAELLETAKILESRVARAGPAPIAAATALVAFERAAAQKPRVRIEAEKDDNRFAQSLRRVLELDPESVPALLELAELDGFHRPFVERARGPIATALRVAPAAVRPNYLALALEQPFRPRAVQEAALRRARQRSHAPWVFAAHHADLLAALDRRIDAAVELRGELARRPGDPNLIRSLIDRESALLNGDAAIALSESLFDLNPLDHENSIRLAGIVGSRGDLAAQRAILDRALRYGPEERELLWAAAEAARRAKDIGATREYLDRLLVVHPGDKEALRYRQFLDVETKPFEDAFPFDAAALVKAAPKASENPMGAPDRVLRRETAIYLNENGTRLEFHREVVQILNDAGARKNDRRGLWQRGMAVRVKEARVFKADGAVVEAAVDGAAVDPGDLAQGDVLEIAWRADERTQSFFGNYLGYSHVFRPADLAECAESILHIIAPKSRPLHFHSRGEVPEPTKRPFDAERDCSTWTIANLARLEREPLMPDLTEIGPVLEVSTYASWDEFGTWWWNLIKRQFTLSDAMRRKVEEITAGKATRDEKVRAIYDFVTSDIRYVAWEFGVHGYKPYDAKTIFERRFGDCKDKAILISTMSRAIGIETFPVLIALEERRSIEDTTLPIVSHFNHCIAYLPGENGAPGRFLDGTAEFHEMENLPEGDRDASVVIVREGGTAPARTPAHDPEASLLALRVSGRLSADGAFDGQAKISAGGMHGPEFRALFETEADRKSRIEEWFGRSFAKTTVGLVSFQGLGGTATPVEGSVTFSAQGFGIVQNGALTLKASPREARLSRFAAREKRDFDLVLGPQRSETDEFEVALPDGHEVAAKPAKTELDGKFGRYSLSAETVGKNLVIRRFLMLKTTRVAVADYPAFRDFCQEVDRAESEIITIRGVAR